MIILNECKKAPIKTAVFDFDGTISTLRCGWESVMEPLMTEILYGDHPTEHEIQHVRDYISASTGIQTILQMKWICEELTAMGREPLSPWDYKAEYNRRQAWSGEASDAYPASPQRPATSWGTSASARARSDSDSRSSSGFMRRAQASETSPDSAYIASKASSELKPEAAYSTCPRQPMNTSAQPSAKASAISSFVTRADLSVASFLFIRSSLVKARFRNRAHQWLILPCIIG
jgi:hypothetical protein